MIEIQRIIRRFVGDRAGSNYGGTMKAHQPTPHQLKHVPLNRYVILYKSGLYADLLEIELVHIAEG